RVRLSQFIQQESVEFGALWSIFGADADIGPGSIEIQRKQQHRPRIARIIKAAGGALAIRPNSLLDRLDEPFGGQTRIIQAADETVWTQPNSMIARWDDPSCATPQTPADQHQPDPPPSKHGRKSK